MERLITFEDLLVKFGIDLYSVSLNQHTTSLEVSFALDALQFAKNLGEVGAQLVVVVDLDIGLAVTLGEAECRFTSVLIGILLGQCKGPIGDKCTVAHMCLLQVIAWLNANQLSHQAVHHLLIVSSLVSIGIGHNTKLDELGIRHIIKCKDVGTSLLKGRTVGFQCIGINARQQLTAGMAQALVKIGMNIIHIVGIFLCLLNLCLTPHKLFTKAITLGSSIVGSSDVVDAHRLRAMLGTNPVGVGQVDADRCRWIAVTCQDGSSDDLGSHTLDHRLAETCIDR